MTNNHPNNMNLTRRNRHREQLAVESRRDRTPEELVAQRDEILNQMHTHRQALAALADQLRKLDGAPRRGEIASEDWVKGSDKVRENHCRRAAKRQGLVLEKSRSRDPRSREYGTYRVLGHPNGPIALFDHVYGLTLNEVEAYLFLGQEPHYERGCSVIADH